MDQSLHTCNSCSQILKNLEHAKCMYCGEPLPEALLLSQEEASEILQTKHEKWRKENEENQWGLQKDQPNEDEQNRRLGISTLLSTISLPK